MLLPESDSQVLGDLPTVGPQPRPDWLQAAGGKYAELEVFPERPRSLETLYIVDDGALYVAANTPTRKRWPGEVREDGRVRVRVGGGCSSAVQCSSTTRSTLGRSSP